MDSWEVLYDIFLFVVELKIKLLLQPLELINKLFELFKKDPKDYIELYPLKIWYQFIFEDKTRFNYSGDETDMKKQIEKINQISNRRSYVLLSFIRPSRTASIQGLKRS